MKIIINDKQYIIFQSGILIIEFILFFILKNREQNQIDISIIIALDLFSILIFLFRKEQFNELEYTNIRAVYIFLISYIIVYFQLNIDYILGNIGININRIWVSSEIVIQSLIISSMGFTSFLIGYSQNKNKKSKQIVDIKQANIIFLKLLATVLYCLFIVNINPLYILRGYGVYEMGDVSRYCAILFELTMAAVFMQISINLKIKNKKISLIKYIKEIGIYNILLIFNYFVIVLLSGDRGPIIYTLLGFIGAYVYLTNIKISKIKVIIIIIIAAVILSIMGLVRANIPRGGKMDLVNIVEIVRESKKPYKQLEGTKSIFNPTIELATSVRTLHTGIDYINNSGKFFYGKFQLYQLATIIPLGQKILQRIFGEKEYYLSSERFITYLIGGEGGGEGTCCIIDIYLDFGLIGVIIIMFIFGIYLRKIDINIFSKMKCNLIELCSYIVLFQYSVYIPRSTIISNIRNIIWLYLILKTNLYVSKIIKNFKNYAEPCADVVR